MQKGTAMKKGFFKIKALSLGVLTALSTNMVIAQESDPKTEKEEVERIMVTATKRNADVQDVSVAVTAIGPDAIKQGGNEEITNLEHLVAGMKLGQ